MRKEYEQRPIDTKVIRENFHGALERKMNSLMSQGYVPMGGTSTIMNTNARPILKMDVKEYIQTMIKYGNFEIWIKESELDRSAYKSEQSREHLTTQQSRLESSIEKHSKLISQLKSEIADSTEDSSADTKSFFKVFKSNMKKAQNDRRKTKLLESLKVLSSNKSDYKENEKELDRLDTNLMQFYSSNPSITKDILLASR